MMKTGQDPIDWKTGACKTRFTRLVKLGLQDL